MRIKFFSLCVFLLLSLVVNVQIMISSISGCVVDIDGIELVGVIICVVYMFFGLIYGIFINVFGYYMIQGMCVGGLYEIEVIYVGYES